MAKSDKEVVVGVKQLPKFSWKTTNTPFRKLLNVWKLSGIWDPVKFYELVDEKYHQFLPYGGEMEEVDDGSFVAKGDGFSPYYYTKPNKDDPFSYRRKSIGFTPSNLTELDLDECLIHIEIIPKQRNQNFKHPKYESLSIAQSEIMTLRMVDYVSSSKCKFDVSAYGFKHCEMKVTNQQRNSFYHSKGGMFFVVKNFSQHKTTLFNFAELIADSDLEVRAHYFHKMLEVDDTVDLNEWCFKNQSDRSVRLIGGLKRINRKSKNPNSVMAKVDDVYNLTQLSIRKKPFYQPKTTDSLGNDVWNKIEVVKFPPKLNQQSKFNSSTHIYNSTDKWLNRLSNSKYKSIFIPLNKWIEKNTSNSSSNTTQNNLEWVVSENDPNTLHNLNMEEKNHFKHFYKFNTNTKSTPFYLPPKIYDERNRKLKFPIPQITYPFHLKSKPKKLGD